MFHKAIDLQFGTGTKLIVVFQSGEVKEYDISRVFEKYPQMRALTDRNLFLSGKLEGQCGIRWNDELDIEVETIYREGTTIRQTSVSAADELAHIVSTARSKKGITQNELAKASGIAQADISRIERGKANPSLNTLERIAKALDTKIVIGMK